MRKTFISIIFIFMAIMVESQVVTPNTTTLPQIIPQQNSSDLQLTANVNQQLRANVRNFAPQNYNIFSQEGQVTIQGRAASQSEADEILSMARSTPGVLVIVNGIIVSP